ncbi:MAG: hypothetical protein GX309_13465 [Clostridiales bacterium]|nr:hypothetical protein [Clostridiales bacterium]
MSALPLYTATDELIDKILRKNNILNEEKIKEYVINQRKMIDEILKHDTITEEIPILTEEEFKQFPMTLSLSGMFFEKDIFYSWEDYQKHLYLIREYEKSHVNYIVKENFNSAFRNIQIVIHEGKWVILSKNKTPAIHFLIQHPKMINAFENMIIQVIEDR